MKTKVLQISRLFITPKYRIPRNIIDLFVGAFFVAKEVMKAELFLSATGVKQKQDRFATKLFGAKPVSIFPEPIFVSKYNDSVKITSVDLIEIPYKKIL